MELTQAKADGNRNTAGRIIKVNHSGEFGAVNIYRAQILVGRLFRRSQVSQLEHFLEHEKEHLAIFAAELERRGVRRCRSYYLCGMGGFVLGMATALLGSRAVMACTAAVETVVLRHLEEQLSALAALNDSAAYDAVNAIVEDERAHQEAGLSANGYGSALYRPLVKVVEGATEVVIWLGMKL